MATGQDSLSNSAGESELNQDNTNCKLCFRKEFADLILWRKWVKSILAFVIIQGLIYDFTYKSAISVVSVYCQIILWFSIAYRVYVWCLQCLNRTQIRGNPFQIYMDMDISITSKQSDRLSLFIATNISLLFTHLRSVVLMESPFKSIKVMVILGVMSLVGRFFYVSTLLRFGILLLFTLPKIYEWKQPLIDARLHKLKLIFKHFCTENSKKRNSKILVDLDEKTLDQCDTKTEQKNSFTADDTFSSAHSEITEDLRAGGDDSETMKMEEESLNEFEKCNKTWDIDDIEYMNRQNL